MKHRQNKSQKPRILAFVSSPIKESGEELKRLAQQMKKNNVAVDVVSFGEDDANDAKLKQFVDTVNRDDNSHYVTIPSGAHVILSEALVSTEIMGGSHGSGHGSSQGMGIDDFDPNLDPELALALQLSLQESQQAQSTDEKMDIEEKN